MEEQYNTQNNKRNFQVVRASIYPSARIAKSSFYYCKYCSMTKCIVLQPPIESKNVISLFVEKEGQLHENIIHIWRLLLFSINIKCLSFIDFSAVIWTVLPWTTTQHLLRCSYRRYRIRAWQATVAHVW